MYTHHRIAIFILGIETIDRLDHIGDGAAGLKVVAHHIDADLLVRGVISIDRRRHAFHRAAVAERAPVAQCADDGLATRGGVGNPLPAERIEHVVAHVVHDLDALHFRVDVQRIDDDVQQLGPGVLKHAAGGVDHEDDVFAVHRDTAHQIVLAGGVHAHQALHLVGQRLFCGSKLLGLLNALLGDAVRGVELPLNGGEFTPQIGDAVLNGRELLPFGVEIAIDHLGFAANLEELLLQVRDRQLLGHNGGFDGDGWRGICDQQQQDHRPEATGDHVEKRHGGGFC